MRFLALLFGRWVYNPYSVCIALLLRMRGVSIGRNFYIEGVPLLKLEGKASDITIGNNVKVMGDCDIRNRESGKIVIGDGCRLDASIRLVAANDATLSIGDETSIGCYTVCNCGTDVTIGKKCLISGFVYVQSSNHGIDKNQWIQDQKHTYGTIVIEDDVWVGSHASILPGVSIKKGAVVANKAVVTKNVSEYEIVAGVPAQHVRYRT